MNSCGSKDGVVMHDNSSGVHGVHWGTRIHVFYMQLEFKGEQRR